MCADVCLLVSLQRYSSSKEDEDAFKSISVGLKSEVNFKFTIKNQRRHHLGKIIYIYNKIPLPGCTDPQGTG